MVKKIYVVEDDNKNMKLFRVLLRSTSDVEVIEATEGDEGLEVIKSGEPDLIILDIKLPNMSGIEICKNLRKIDKFKKVPIIAVTAHAMSEDKERILKAGFDEYMTKPIEIGIFRSTIRKYLNQI